MSPLAYRVHAAAHLHGDRLVRLLLGGQQHDPGPGHETLLAASGAHQRAKRLALRWGQHDHIRVRWRHLAS